MRIFEDAIKQSDSIHLSNERIIENLKAQILEKDNVINGKNDYIANQEKIHDRESALLKDNAKRPFGIGLIGGGGYGTGGSGIQGFIGIGVAWQPFRF
ncbi:MAG: hypothetical protein ABIN48_11575 [Ginsengibacter sp.]